MDFKECFREHESTKTIQPVYKVMGLTYKYTKLVTYHIFVLLLGFILAVVFALINAFVSFVHVWIFGPLAKVVLLWVYAIIPLAVAPLKAFFTPLVDVHARIFRQIRVNLSGAATPTYYPSRERSNV